MRFLALFALALSTASVAQEREVPYWATIRAERLNMRAGPGRDYPIRWVYLRAGLPIKVVRVHEGWRLIRDPGGDEGWVTANLLSKDRGALVVGKGLADIRDKPADAARLNWNAEPGVVARLGDCDAGWCRVDVGGRKGYIRQARLWGPGEP